MYRIEKEFHFSASHQLGGLPDDHQCARLHGHNYILKVALEAPSVDDVGFVVDYGDLDFVKETVDELDHRHLNDIFDFNPTSENICKHYWSEFREAIIWLEYDARVDVLEVSLSETPKTWASYRGNV